MANTVPFEPVYIILFLLLLFVIAIFESIRLTRSDGHPRRGFIIWKRLLSTEEKQYLTRLNEDIVIYW
ncbi:MAG: hypothetical protein WBW94_15985, partial [Anaerolineales bacterium]